MYEIWMKNYPQADVNVTEEWDLEKFSTLKRANLFCDALEVMYSDEAWRGHRMYKAKFYVEEVME